MGALAKAPGVLRAPVRTYVGIEDIMVLLGCQKSKASEYIKDINSKSKEDGRFAFPAGKANKYLFSAMSGLPIEDINKVLKLNDRRAKHMRELAEKYSEAHQKAAEDWGEGKILDVWEDEQGNVCIKYESGKWWHYRGKKDGEAEWW